MVVQCKTLRRENTHISNTKTGQVLFRNMYVYTYTHAIQLVKKEAGSLAEKREVYIGGLEEGKGRRECILYILASKSLKNVSIKNYFEVLAHFPQNDYH